MEAKLSSSLKGQEEKVRIPGNKDKSLNQAHKFYLYKAFTESLILAQDERWRRA